ncbi:DUF2752 domain-containing protein [Streptomyces ficellus]|uniref:DUF2752 domain-containing protein n=1 Tax=Streptomyces ficellus TaxID=1977088 RepID=A0A6I6FAU8_9ACTN|nr:DUF2752 domain-containing protein [Streptomyces ficellus]QGV81123.1 DUF2752 domain-containing protein [Streptomyces ficellus]
MDPKPPPLASPAPPPRSPARSPEPVEPAPGAVTPPSWARHAVVGPPGPPSRARRLTAPLGILAAAVTAFVYVGAVDPNEPGHYPVCPLVRFTGILCPGCGGLRSAHAFVHGDLATALGANAFAVAGYLVFAVVMALWLVRAVRGTPFRITLGPVWWWSAGALLAVFSVVRNLPFGSALAP